ncbi:MAG: adenylate/guanylate cyclase domain-containing protein [Mesorhizobium sp.]|nr:MAG: adenylate/guanylate cyclase domain-containing protein [Mesorhizobium sp.]
MNEESRTMRRLAAILAADVVGYSRLMGIDEEGTLAALKAHRKEVIDPLIAQHQGRVFKTTGDGLLIEFASIVDAVRCAIVIQQGIENRNANVDESRRIRFRVGINVGDVIVEGDDIFGDGVNVAARLQTLAEPGRICVSATVREHVVEKLPIGFADLGEHSVKNIARPVHVYRIETRTEPRNVDVIDQQQTVLALPDRPSIAVLPFTNLSGDPEQDYFADGLVEDVITGLSKFPGFFVIARNSTFPYKGKAVDVRQVAKDLGVRYVLEGSVRKSANRLRITGQLIEGAAGTHVWADKFEGPLEDVFDLQDQLTGSIVGAIEPSLRRAEIQRARLKRTESLGAYDLYLRALPHAFANTSADNDQALALLGQALKLDPEYAAAHAYAAWVFEQRFLRGGFRPDDRGAAQRHAHLALTLGVDDAQALAIGAFVLGNITHDYDAAVMTLDRALKVNPNSALALGFSSLVHMFSERYERASDDAARALRLSPFDPLNYHPYLALAWTCFFTGRLTEAATYAALALEANPGFSVLHAAVAAVQAELGRADAARAAATRLLEVAPEWTISGFVRMELMRPELMDKLASALRKTGLPE